MAKSGSESTVFVLLVIFIVGTLTANIQINSGAQNILVGIGNKLTLDCYVTGYKSLTPPNFTWGYPNGVNVTIATQNDSTKGIHSILTINNFTIEHASSYNCTYKGVNADTNVTTIDLKYVNEQTTESEYFFGNQSAILMCTIEFDGKSGNFTEWQKDNKTLKQLENNARFTNYDNGTLVISHPTRNDAGIYVAQFNVSGNQIYGCEVTYKAAPLVLDMEKSKNVVEDDNFELHCEVKGYPQPRVTWLKNGVALVQDDRTSFNQYDGVENAQLSIKSAKMSDKGNYTCEAVLLGVSGQNSSKSSVVRIKDRLEWLWPIIGIICEAVVLSIVIFVCTKFRKESKED